jgi:YD repeat-containing protein
MRKPKSDMAHGWDRDKRLQEEDSMSSHLAPTPAVTPPTPHPAAGAPPALSTAAAPPSAAAPVSLDTLPSSPAAQIHTELSAQGRELRFVRDAQGGRTRIEVRDRGGNVLRTLSPAQALAVAAGAPLE